MTPPKKWPEQANWAREEAIATIDAVCRELDDLMDEDLPLPVIRRIGKQRNKLTKAQIGLITCKSIQTVKE